MEVAQYIVEVLGTTGICLVICYYVMKSQQKQNEKLLDFMLDQIKKQTDVLETIKEQMTIIKEDLNKLKGDE